MRIQIVNVKGPYKEGRFNKLDVSYISEGVKKDRKLVAVGETEEVINVLRNAKADEEYEVKVEKKGEFWNWNAISKLEASAAASGGGRSSYGGDRYEGAEERAKRQEYIIRQSCLTNAVNYISSGKANIPAEVQIMALLDIAEQFVDWVYNDKPVDEESGGDDLPWKKD